MHEIRFAQGEELVRLQDFLRHHWRQDHIFVRDSNLLRWQHLDRDRLNFVVAVNTDNGEWDAVLGFIPLAHFDPALEDERDFWLAIWKVNEQQVEAKGLGIRLLSFLKKNLAPHSIGSIGLSPAARDIYQVYGYTLGVLRHYYRLRDLQIARLPRDFRPGRAERSGSDVGSANFSLSRIHKLEEISHLHCPFTPRKSALFLWNRYVLHPIYRYQLWGANRNRELSAVFVIRRVEVGKAACLRIIDIFGEVAGLSNGGLCFDRLLEEENAEYIDCLNHGLPEEFFSALGLAERQGDEIVIPHHFEPFERKNREVAFAYKSDRPGYVIFKGDSDQDRPSLFMEPSGVKREE